MFTVNKNATEREIRKFAWAMLIGFGVIAIILWAGTARRRDVAIWQWTASAGQCVALGLALLGLLIWATALLSPKIGRSTYVAWMTVTVPLGVAMSFVLLTVLFFVLLPPFSFIVRLSDPLRRKLTKDRTYWEDYRPHEPTLERMARPF